MTDRALADGRVTPAGQFARRGFTDAAGAVRSWAALDCQPTHLLPSLSAAADPDLALRALTRLMTAAAGGAPQLRSALSDDPTVAHRLCLVLGASSALGDHLVRHPEDWRELARDRLDSTRPTAAALHETLSLAQDRDELRRTYRRLLLGIAARDLGHHLDVGDVAAELADLATGAVAAALRQAFDEVGEATHLCRLSVIGMGKCGARELNYVSDVDVIFVAEAVKGADESSALRAATAVAAAMMRVCSDHTREGTLWPVDAGLRPEGGSGPLVRTIASHAAYYQRWAKTWEFQALLKARPIAGDADLGRRYMQAITPMVWSAADRPDFVSDVQAMRRRVIEQLDHGVADRELKLGPGGLRDIEFAVQLLQLVHGRTDESLRSADTLSALAALTAGGYVGRDDGARLAEAYRFLRTLEHRLQLRHLRRTHVVPDDPTALRWLGRSIGLTSAPDTELVATWRQHTHEVRRLHEKLFYRPLLAAVAALPGDGARLTPTAARERLEALGYADPAGALRHLEALTQGVSRRAAIQRTLLPALLGWFADAPDPDTGLLAFRRLSEALGSTHWYLRMLRDEGAAAQRLALLLATSRYAADLLMRAPEACALLASDDDLQPRDTDALTREICSAALRHTDPIEAITAVRALRRRELLRVAAADVFGLLDVDSVGRALTSVARATLEAGLAVARAAVEGERGAPVPTDLAVVAMGRLGGFEMSYASDVDVLFVHQPHVGADEQEAQEGASAVASELRRLLALTGPDPALTVDADLRPEGRQGPLVRTLTSYQAYYERWSKLWENQALLRARTIAGDRKVGEAFTVMIDPLRYRNGGLSAAEVVEIRRIKARVDAERLPRGADPNTHLKLGRGGLADVEWTVQLLQLRYAGNDERLRSTSTLQALNLCVEAGLLTVAEAEALAASWRFASRIRNASMLVRGRPSDSLPSGPRDRRGVA
ncbi:MAG: bifunctional [glutamine synthetase] adenylyltransferase/[glutamine synthetase]-adenylyl-L-tyrosine phosphorylase, partial [Propionibacteriales bacterium]|nr:bifunctional [glutamine synthetase] adenylyltransferase/[glutamine synthetase]-adenylyl-L-tyrosine phosphorylase [Propionibacteriales bacterium]